MSINLLSFIMRVFLFYQELTLLSMFLFNIRVLNFLSNYESPPLLIRVFNFPLQCESSPLLIRVFSFSLFKYKTYLRIKLKVREFIYYKFNEVQNELLFYYF